MTSVTTYSRHKEKELTTGNGNGNGNGNESESDKKNESDKEQEKGKEKEKENDGEGKTNSHDDANSRIVNASKKKELTPEQKARQALGANVFACYVVVLFVCILVSGLGYIPELEWEKPSYVWVVSNIETMKKLMPMPFLLGMLYYIFIFGVQAYMKDKAPYDLRTSLGVWSLALALFSFAGAIRTVPVFIQIVREKGWHYMICEDSKQDWVVEKASGIWVYLFILSKVPELIDTVFIVFRKSPLVVLHWYHHITVMLFCWHSWANYSVNGLVFAAMNLTVHAIMYFFYMLTAFGYRPTKFAQWITIIQLSQMVVGTLVSGYTVYHQTFVKPREFSWKMYDSDKELESEGVCVVNPGNAVWGLLMYISYFLLFFDFFLRTYIFKKNKKEKLA